MSQVVSFESHKTGIPKAEAHGEGSEGRFQPPRGPLAAVGLRDQGLVRTLGLLDPTCALFRALLSAKQPSTGGAK